jgi:hypothetical protein
MSESTAFGIIVDISYSRKLLDGQSFLDVTGEKRTPYKSNSTEWQFNPKQLDNSESRGHVREMVYWFQKGTEPSW